MILLRRSLLSPLVLLTAGAFSGCACSEPTPPQATQPGATSVAPAQAPSSSADPALPSASAAASAAPAPVAQASASASASAPLPAPVAGTRIWGKSRFAWIHPSPVNDGAWTGYIGLGGSAPLKGGSLESARTPQGGGCPAWYAIEPAGFVCANELATTDPTEAMMASLIENAGKTNEPWPFEYGESLGTPRYTHIPTPAELRSSEWDLEPHLAKMAKIREAKSPEEIAKIDKEMVGVDLTLSGNPAPKLAEVTVFVREGRKYVALGSTVAWAREFDVVYPGGEYGLTTRTYLLTSDHAIVPKDRVRPYPKSQFKGFDLTGDIKLPIAYFRKTPRPKYKRNADGSMAPTGETWPARAWTMVIGEDVTVGKDRFLATREEGIYAKAEDASVIALATPPSNKILEAQGRGTWLDISILGGWLVAYEKTKPVWATLISPGRGGIPYPGIDPLVTASTPVGNFRVDGKFQWATMVSSTNSDLVHSEVQYVQNFHGPHALHGAYWHDSFGEPKSGGCVNLSPMDAKWLFAFTEPALPPGWQGIRAVDQAGYATIVSVHR